MLHCNITYNITLIHSNHQSHYNRWWRIYLYPKHSWALWTFPTSLQWDYPKSPKDESFKCYTTLYWKTIIWTTIKKNIKSRERHNKSYPHVMVSTGIKPEMVRGEYTTATPFLIPIQIGMQLMLYVLHRPTSWLLAWEDSERPINSRIALLLVAFSFPHVSYAIVISGITPLLYWK